MPNIKSAKKRVLVNKAKALQNRAVRSALRNNAAHKKSGMTLKLNKLA